MLLDELFYAGKTMLYDLSNSIHTYYHCYTLYAYTLYKLIFDAQ